METETLPCLLEAKSGYKKMHHGPINKRLSYIFYILRIAIRNPHFSISSPVFSPEWEPVDPASHPGKNLAAVHELHNTCEDPKKDTQINY